MNETDMSLLTVSGIEMVVYLVPGTDTGFTPVEGMMVKRFGPRRYHGLVYRLSGTNRYIVEEKYALSLQPGDILYLPQGRPYIVQAGKPGDCYCVNFYIDGNPALEPFLQTPRNRAKWQAMFAEMASGWTYRKPGYRAKCLSILYEMLCTVEEDKQARYLPAQHITAIRGVIDQLEGDIGEASIPRLAEACGMSETYFRRLFRELYGTSPKQYLLEARFRRAKALLEGTDAPIARVAEASGFESIYLFSRAFKLHEGMSPSEYRNKRR